MAGRKFTVAFPMPCDRSGRIMRPGDAAVQRTYPTRTYVTHIVCPGRAWKRGRWIPTGPKQPAKPETKQQEKEN